MTNPEISEAAKVRANELVAAQFDIDPSITSLRANQRALSRFIQTTSDVAKGLQALIFPEPGVTNMPSEAHRKVLQFLILPEPKDPLEEVCDDMGLGHSKTAADELREALAKRNLQITPID